MLEHARPTEKYVSRFGEYRRSFLRRMWKKLEMPRTYAAQFSRGKPEIVERILALLKNGPLRPSVIRKAIGINSSIHFNRYYLSPMLAQGLIARTDPEHPQSPQQKYRLP